MGWARGTDLFAELMPLVRIFMPERMRTVFYTGMIEAFQNYDWDGIDALEGNDKHYDAAVRIIRSNDHFTAEPPEPTGEVTQ